MLWILASIAVVVAAVAYFGKAFFTDPRRSEPTGGSEAPARSTSEEAVDDAFRLVREKVVSGGFEQFEIRIADVAVFVGYEGGQVVIEVLGPSDWVGEQFGFPEGVWRCEERQPDNPNSPHLTSAYSTLPLEDAREALDRLEALVTPLGKVAVLTEES